LRTIEQITEKPDRPLKDLQFGEGRFLRAFADYMLDVSNAKGITDFGIYIVKPRANGSFEEFAAQNYLYTVLLRGFVNGKIHTHKHIVTGVTGAVNPYADYELYESLSERPELRFIISNTTEAGIIYNEEDRLSDKPPETFPGKLTKFLYKRFVFFDKAPDKGLIILPTELIEQNGGTLKAICLKLSELWWLPPAFSDWLNDSNIFCDTLVDRIVTGFPADEAKKLENEWGYTDKFIVCAEPFAQWVIACAEHETVHAAFPLDKAGLPVIFTDNLDIYRERKVRILNGGHTALMPVAYLLGKDTVGSAVRKHSGLRRFLEWAVDEELAASLEHNADDLKQFARTVMERFENPYIKHELIAISMNSISKFKTRVLPAIKAIYEKTGTPPKALCFSLAALIVFYSGKKDGAKFIGRRDRLTYEINDSPEVLEFFAENAVLPPNALTEALLRQTRFWGEDLTKIQGLSDMVSGYLQDIRADRRDAFRKFITAEDVIKKRKKADIQRRF